MQDLEVVGDAGEAAYIRFHTPRFRVLDELCRRHVPAREAAVLDVGRGPFSRLLRRHYESVTTLGFPLGDVPHYGLAGHIEFDLNDILTGARPPEAGPFDLVVFAETVEHLTTPPHLVLAALATLMKPGGRMVCQTPNAAALANRIKLLVGRNPYEMLRAEPFNPGHIREYTGAELRAECRRAGLAPVEHVFREYFAWPNGAGRRVQESLIRACSAVVPAFRRGQVIVLERTA